MCSTTDAVAMLFGGTGGAMTLAAGQAMTKKPQQPDVVREDPAAQQAKIESDAAQSAQLKTLEQRRRARVNSLLSLAGGTGDPSTASVRTPQVTGKPYLGT